VRDAAAALAAAAAGADFIGLIFAPSKRQVTVAAAAEIVRAVREARPRPAGWAMGRFPARATAEGCEDAPRDTRQWLEGWSALLRRAASQGGPLIVGVFVDASVDEMNEAAEAAGLDLIQLHGQSEGWDVASTLCRPAVSVVHMEPQMSADQVCAQLRAGPPAAVLLDSKGGGTGKTFDWGIGAEAQGRAPFILAGGLTPDNVAAAVRQVRPWCVDVSSGVETDGMKDHEKIRDYVRNAKEA
jgi:phosphoribosylanthranilate isomerase